MDVKYYKDYSLTINQGEELSGLPFYCVTYFDPIDRVDYVEYFYHFNQFIQFLENFYERSFEDG